MALFTDRRRTGYGGAHYTETLLKALRGDGFATVEVIGPREFPQSTLIAEIDDSPRSKLVKWLRGRTEADFDKLPIKPLLASDAERPFDAAVLDGSLLGCNLSRIRVLLPQATMVTAFHNVEIDFIDSQRVFRRPHLMVKRRAVERAERSASNVDVRIALHMADSERLRAIYGKPATCIFPITMGPVRHSSAEKESRKWILFVGSLFRPNVEAVRWIYKELAPIIPCEVVVVGRRMEELRLIFPDTDRFRIVGSVTDLEPYYRQAYAVISPVKIGGGMKVKNVEALAYGKKVIASPHSAVGLDDAVDRGYVIIARTKEEWRAAVGTQIACAATTDGAIAEWCMGEFGFERRAAELRLCLNRQLRARNGGKP